jgi:exodeoxyribonuclease V alpha subunit
MSLLEQLWSYGVLSPLDYHFARSLEALGGASEEALFCAALASRAVQMGHVCLDLARVQDVRFVDRSASATSGAAAELVCPAPERLLAALRSSPLCSDGQTALPTPLVLDAHGRLYLQRYARHERELAAALLARAQPVAGVDLERLGQRLRRRYATREAGARAMPAGTAEPAALAGAAEPDALELAAIVAALQRLAVICGGPGTGKTTTVVKILALLEEQALEETGVALGITLLAPTGKAAQRLASSVSSGLDALQLAEPVRAAIPGHASTIHRALGGGRGASGRFWHDADNPLPADLVVVDEVSMVDLVLLQQLVSALRPEARLILLGDKDQLTSVEAGAILGDIYDAGAASRWSTDFARRVQAATGQVLRTAPDASRLSDCLVSLEQSHRYAADSGIGRLARAINQGSAEAALELLESSRASQDCRRFEPDARSSTGQPLLEHLATSGYRPFLESTDPALKLSRLESYRVLCAHRQGGSGVERLNADIERWLARAGLIVAEGRFYENRPVLITRNDYGLGLFNGDVGVVVREGERLRVCFQGTEGLRFLAPSRLPPHETVFAMTIHKSQGSEFDAVSVMLPETPSPLLSRELLYTAVTRARRRVDVVGSREVIRAAVSRAIQRASGLHDALWSVGEAPVGPWPGPVE